MLKIKDNVDLKELEKFGWSKNRCGEYVKHTANAYWCVREKADLEAKLAESNENVKLLAETRVVMCDTIKDLETKLTESQNDYLLLEEQLENANDWRKDFQQENKQLKQQLAEKEKLIKFYINSGKEQCDEINKLNSRILNYCNEIDKSNQEKTTFAIEKLEQVKEYADVDYRKNCYINAVELDKYIDNQINQLKGMNEDEKL